MSTLWNFQEFKSWFLNNQETKMKLVDLGALGVLFSVSFVWLPSFCRKNLKSWWIFREALKIRTKTGLSPISALHYLFVDKTDLGALRTFFAVNINFIFLIYLQNLGSWWIFKKKSHHFQKVVSDWSANQDSTICFLGVHL